MTVGLVYDLRSDYLAQGYGPEQVAEFDSDETISAIEAALRSLGYRTDRIGSAKALCARLVAGSRWDLVFNFAEGLAGRSREAQAPCLLELYGIGYTFSDPLVCAATLDKAVAKRLVSAAGLATPKFRVVREISDLAAVDLAYPLFAKPLAEGTGKGIDRRSRIESPQQLEMVCRDLLARLGQPVLVEEFLPGREFTVAVLGTGRDARVLGTMEIALRDGAAPSIYTYETKERCEQLVTYSAPPRDALRRQVEGLALASYLALECRDAARVDLRLDCSGRPSFMEVNPLPGLHPSHSDLPMIATQEGMAYRDLIGAILASACRRLGIPT
ncbi:MAG: D-alanine--D-alanine ligase [Planctomycetota bacterium]|nr:D-alanine--D-alanine ligase [Planctomycetota bacterium]